MEMFILLIFEKQPTGKTIIYKIFHIKTYP